ncbi:MAG: hypothetical protein BIFFINMI_01445 [Phycisphaerae bacterium]|nr:hypothetical protein [Phycisphaerae bacterium]
MKAWMTGLIALLAAAPAWGVSAPTTQPEATITIYERAGQPAAANRIDELIFARLDAEGVSPARVCSDAVFVRRVYLDVTGTLPTAAEARAFLADRAPDRRARLIDRLLADPRFADYRAMQWGDLLRIKSEFPINLWPNAVQAYHRWVRTALADGMPYDRFARELLTASGSNFRVGQVNFYRAVQSRDPATLAKSAALAFMGDRMTDWPADRAAGLAAFFSRVGYKSTDEWKEEIVYFNFNPASPPVASALLPDGSTVKLAADGDPREAFADWLVSPDNPWFARCQANRIWYRLMGRGLVQEPDDFRAGNPPSHPELLDWLASELVKSKFDSVHLYRLILNSTTYQLSSVPGPGKAAGPELFAAYRLRRLEAEVLIDALCQITGTDEQYESRIPEPFTWVPREMRSIALPDGSITSSFLDLFGRPPRDTGLASERNNATSADQQLHLLNSSHVRNKIEGGPTMRAIGRTARQKPGQAMDELYLTVLSRYPTGEELRAIKVYTDATRGKGGNVLGDVMWALVNSTEFQYRH